MKLDAMIGNASFFSCEYRPGATNAHIWYSTTGSASTNATSSVTLTGTRNGVMTPVAIIFVPSGSALSIGSAITS